MNRSLFALLNLAVVIFGSHHAAARTHRTYLIAAGNNAGNPDESKLLYAEREAVEFAGVMRQLGGVRAQDAVVALGEDATNLRNIVLTVNARIRSSKYPDSSGTTLIMYYSGHADAQGLHLSGSILAFDELRTMMVGSPADIRVLIIDACRSGGVTQVKGGTPAEAFPIEMLVQTTSEGLVIITSSAANEDSYESEKYRSSFFSHHLIAGLRGAADRNRDGIVTVDEAYRYTYKQTLKSSSRTLRLQHPTYRFDIKGRGNLTLTRLLDHRLHFGRLIIPQSGFYLVEHKTKEGGTEVYEVTVEEMGTQLVVHPGHYFVQQRGKETYLEYRFELSPNAQISLADIAPRTVRYAQLVRKGGSERNASFEMSLLAAARGEVIDGLGPTPHGLVEVALELPWLSFGLRGRYSINRKELDSAVSLTQHEFGIAAVTRKFWDLNRVSPFVGGLIEGSYQIQTFETPGQAPDRRSWSLGFGILFGGEIIIHGPLVVVVEAGPLTQVWRRSVIDQGVETGGEWDSRLTWWGAAGVGWKF